MAYDATDAVTARALFEDAIGVGSTPDLTSAQIDRYFGLASDARGTYPAVDLNRAAAVAWDTKSNLTADRYDLGGGPGVTLKESQWHQFCKARAADYRYGIATVTGEDVRADLDPEAGLYGQTVTVYGNFLTGPWEDE